MPSIDSTHISSSQNFEPGVNYHEGGEEGDVEINFEDYLRVVRRPTQVTRKNKIVCTTAFVVLIITVCGYVGGLVSFHLQYEVISDIHFKGPCDIIYFLMFSDVVASCVGIWTCLKKTGPQPMIYACIWLLLSSLVNLCVTISLTFETKQYRESKEKACKTPTADTCTVYAKLTIILWCSLLFFGLKFVVIVLCRLNYPQVFNWMMGKDVYVDEELLPSSNRISRAGAFAGAYFDPPDLARIAARGSIKDATIVGSLSDNQAIFVTKEVTEKPKSELTEEKPANLPGTRRSTFVSL